MEYSEVIKDPDFLGLPDIEKAKVLRHVDSDYAGLPENEQMRVIEMLNTPAQAPMPTGVQPTGAVSTITTKPILEPSADAPAEAGFGTMTKASMVRDPQTKMEIYAKARGVPVDRYKLQDNQIVFTDNQGQLRTEEEFGTGSGSIKQFAANIAAQPSIPLGAIGSAGGPVGAAAGGMAGETIRQIVAGVALGDRQTVKGNLINLGAEGILSLLAEYGSRGLTGALNKAMGIGKPNARMLKNAARGDFPHIDRADIQRVKQLGNDFGIDLFSPQTTKSQQLISKMNLLRDLPQTSDIIRAADEIQNEQVQNAIPRFLRDIAPSQPSTVTNRKLRDLSKAAVAGLKTERAKHASPIYKAAFDENPMVKIDRVVDYLDEQLAFAKGDMRRALTKLRKDIVEPDNTVSILNAKGKPVKAGETSEKEATLQGLHGIKILLDKRIRALNKPTASSYDNLISGEMKHINAMLVEAMDAASPTYTKARALHEMLSPAVERAEMGLTGALAKVKEGDISNMSSLILASKHTHPETVAEVKSLIMKQEGGQDIWNAAVRDFIEYTFENIKDSQVGSMTNYGGALRKQIIGNERQRRIMKAALGDKYGNLEDFMEVLGRTGLTFKSESTTATRTMALQEMRDEFESSAVNAATQPLKAPRILLGNKLNELKFEKGAKKLAEALVDDGAAAELARLKQLSPKSEALIKGVASFFELSAAKEARQYMDQ